MNLKTLVLSTMFQKGKSNVKMNKVPESICQLKKLIYLCLYRNDITSLPKCIQNLKNLKKLDLSLTNITSDKIPKALIKIAIFKNYFRINIG